MKFKITVGRNAEQKQWPDTVELSWDELMGSLGDHPLRERKDGPCMVPGVILKHPSKGFARLKSAISEISCLMYDIDGGNSFEEVCEIVAKSGYKAILWTTHSHKSCVTTVKSDAYASWTNGRGRDNEPRRPTFASMLRYLEFAGKGKLKNIKFDPIKDIFQTGEGTSFAIHHDPIDKVRVLFPLSAPIKMIELDHQSKVQQDTYSAIYHGVGTSLGLTYDVACSDPCRLHYLPAHAEQTPHRTVIYNDDNRTFMDWTKLPRAAVVHKTTSSTRESKTVTDSNGDTFNLLAWVKLNGTTFDIAAVLRDRLPDDMIKTDLSDGRDGFHVVCPFEHEHSSDTQGTFVETGDGDTGFKFHCQHNSCKSAERDRLDFLKKYIEDGLLVAADLGIDVIKPKESSKSQSNQEDNFSEGSQKSKAQARREAMEAMGLDFETLPSMDDDEVEDDHVESSGSDDSSIVKDEMLQVLMECRHYTRASNALKHLAEKNIKVDEEEICFALAKSELPMNNLRRLIASYRAIMPDYMEDDEILEQSKERRQAIYPISERMRAYITESRAGLELDTLKNKTAAFYGIPKAAVEVAYNCAKTHWQSESQLNGTLVDKAKGFVRRYAKIKLGASTYYLNMEQSRQEGAVRVHSPEGLAELLRNNRVEHVVGSGEKAKNKEMSLFDYCKTYSPDVREFTGFAFEPAQGPITRKNEWNIWHGFTCNPVDGDASIITDHIRNIWCGGADEETYNWVTTFLAHIFQVPSKKPGTAIALIGPQGTGKSLPLEEGISRMVDPYYGKSSRPEDVCGKFTAGSCNKLVFLSEEAVWAGDKKNNRQMKDRITSKTTRWEEKNIPSADIGDVCRFFFTSNDTHAFDLDEHDRRYAILETATTVQNDLQYFKRMADWFNNEQGCEKWMNFLLKWKPEDVGMTWLDLKRPPRTAARAQQVALSRDASNKFFINLILNGRITNLPRDVDLETRIHWAWDQELVISPEALHIAFDIYVDYEAKGNARFMRKNYIPNFIRLFGDTVENLTKRRMINNVRRSVLILPPRLQVMEAIIKRGGPEFTKADVEWVKENPTSHNAQTQED